MCINSFNVEAMEAREAKAVEKAVEQEERTLNFDEFCNAVEAMVMVKYPDAKVTVREVCKEGDIILHGLAITPEGTNVSPTFYLEHFYDAYENGEFSLSETIEKLAESYETHKVPESFDVSWVMDWKNVKEIVTLKLVNKESNKELLEKTPHIDYLDEMAIIFKILLPNDKAPNGDGMATITISNEMLSRYGIDLATLQEVALKNTEKSLPMKLASMFDTFVEMRGEEFAKEMLPEIPSDGPQMLILTNTEKVSGASTILYPGLLEKIGEKYGDFVLIPSSVHEVIIVTNTGKAEMPKFNDMVKDVNRTEVASNDVLADRAYYYDSKANELQIV